MTPEEKAYIAGIIDGEGSIMLTRFHKNQHHAPCVTIASTTLELLEWIQLKTGVGTIKLKKNYKPSIHTSSYTYIVKYNDAINFISEIEPYLVISQKKRRAQLILNEYKKCTPRNGRYSSDMLQAKEEFLHKFLSIEQSCLSGNFLKPER